MFAAMPSLSAVKLHNGLCFKGVYGIKRAAIWQIACGFFHEILQITLSAWRTKLN
jgi:hypothetical protein